jgi:branched-chain amino acid transport system substrate-binding protein
VPLTGPTAALGIPFKNGVAPWPKTIAGEKLNVIMLDDATDPTIGVKNARRFVTEDKVDLIVGSLATPIAVAMSDVATEGQTVQLSIAPIELPEGKGAWSFRLAQSTAVMALQIVEQWRRLGVKTFGYLGYTDAYGESWLKAIMARAEKAGINSVAVERFARADTGVTGQALKLVSANPDVILIGASGSGAAMPHKGLVERGYAKNKIYRTHGAASLDLIRVGGKDVEGSFVVSGPALVAKLLPDSNPSKAVGLRFTAEYEKAYGKGTAISSGLMPMTRCSCCSESSRKR